MRNKVVVHYLDGQVLKGVTLDFVPNKQAFHVCHLDDEKKVTEVATRSIKAIFFVKSFEGDANYAAAGPTGNLKRAAGRQLQVTFRDGEVIHGTSAAYSPARAGFFLIPADPRDNNDRIYVFTHATRGVEMVASEATA